MADFDMEKFPASPAAQRMLSRVSPVYASSYVAKWLYEVMGQELDEARLKMQELLEQRFPDTVTWGIAYLEHKYSIAPDDSLSLLERRARLKRRQRMRYPLNPRRFERIIAERFGLGVEVNETMEHGVLHIHMETNANLGNPKPLYQEIVRIKPSHLLVSLDSTAQTQSDLYYAAAPTLHATYEIRPAEITDATAEARQYIGAAASTHTTYEVYPDTARDAKASIVFYAGGVGSTHKVLEVTQT